MRTREGGPLLAETSRHPRRSRWLGRVVVVVLVVVVGVGGLVGYRVLSRTFFTPSCDATAAGSTVSFSPDQTANAALITALAAKRGLPPRAATIAIATAIQESKLRNLTFGDRDSVGLFQQRPSQGWGTREQILDPTFATNAFYDALVKIKGYESKDITAVAQQIQRSAFPSAYAEHEREGRILASTLSGQSPAGLVCRLKPVTQAADGTAVVADLEAQYGLKAAQNGALLTFTGASPEQAWSVGQWAVARAEAYGVDRVQVADRVWQRGEDAAAQQWSTGAAAPSPTTVTIRIGAPQG